MNFAATKALALVLLVLTPLTSSAKPEDALILGAPFGNSMVLQRDTVVPIWGRDKRGQTIRVKYEDQVWETTADENGRWEVAIGPFASGTPFALMIEGSESRELIDVLAGEVWHASGQSNMQWKIHESSDPEQAARMADLPNIRYLRIPQVYAAQPQEFVTHDGWRVCTPITVKDFSAVAFHFAHDLHQRLDVPIGIIDTSWGGAAMETFVPLDRMENDSVLSWTEESYQAFFAAEAEKNEFPQIIPAIVYNAMIHPLFPFKFQGIIWYQGESNTPRYTEYRHLNEIMLDVWRDGFRDPELPFLYVQLAGFAVAWPNWIEMVDLQRRMVDLPHAAMVSAIDVGDREDIHPRDKRTVGQRLALAARAIVYGEDIIYTGPLVREAKRQENILVLTFDHASEKLVSRHGGDSVRSFEVSNDGKLFESVAARIEGRTVQIDLRADQDPTIVRYAWESFPECDLYNAVGLPASPFAVEVSSP